jgi:hypothetical protein
MARIQLIYIGRVEHGKDKIVHKYLIRNEDGTLTGKHFLFASKITLHHVGAITEVEEKGNGVKAPYNHLGFHAEPDDMRKWRNRDKAVYDEHMANKQSARKLLSDYDKAIIDLKKSYRELSANQRTVFINRLVLDITKS